MYTTPRNQLIVSAYSNQPSILNEIDFLYEVADAELACDFGTHRLWESLSRKHKEFRKTFARSIQPKIQKIAIENDVKFWCQHWIEVVAERISQDWYQYHFQEGK